MLTKGRLVFVGVCTVCLTASVSAPRGGEFDRLEGDELARATQADTARRHESLSFQEIDSLPAALGDTRSALLVVKTGQGNYARVLVTPALRKPPEGEGAASPVLVLERFDTFEPGKSGSRLGRGSGLILFDGFQLDLDTGQVVPSGQGGDLEFAAKGDTPPVLRAIGKATMFTFSRPLPPAPAAAGPSPGKAVIPGDFAGRYRLFADGRWSGLLELQVEPDRQVTGRFRSEANGTSYPVTGRVSTESPQKAVFTVKFPRTEQEYDAYLWTEGKNVLAGSFTMLDRAFGFFAVREGTRAPQAE
jgi:hypothetical protein